MEKTDQSKPVVIVGAGIAGLHAAYLLEKKSIPYVLIEQSEHVGGRVQTEKTNGYLLDVGFQVLQTSYPGVQQNFDLSALKLKYFESGANIWNGNQFVAFLNPLKDPFAFFKFLSAGILSFSDMIKLARLWFKIQKEINPQLTTGKDVKQYLEEWNFSKEFYDRFIFPFFAGVFLDSEFRQPSILFDFYMKQFLDGQTALPENGIAAISEHLKDRLNPSNLRLNSKIVKIDSKELEFENGSKIGFQKLILAADAKNTAQLLNISLDSHSFNSCTTYYFEADEFPNESKLIHLVPGNSGSILHFTCLTNIQPAYSKNDKKLISVTTLKKETSVEEIQQELIYYVGNLKGMKFVKSYYLPNALPRLGNFGSLIEQATTNEITLLGDYVGIPSLQSAFYNF